VQLIENMEKRLLRAPLVGYELDIVEQEDMDRLEPVAELLNLSLLDGQDEFIGELFRAYVGCLQPVVCCPAGDGVQQMGLAEAGVAIDEEGIVALAGGFSYVQRGGVGQSIGVAYHEGIESVLGVEAV